jgi:sulfopropanediol 3-dehydrogenase
VAEAKRILFGRVGIDMIAGPTDSLILADKTADPKSLPPISSVRPSTATTRRSGWSQIPRVADEVMRLVPELIADLPEVNRDNAAAAWRDYAEVILCDDREEMAATSDSYAPEHLTVQAEDLDWWLAAFLLRLAVPRRRNDGCLWRQGLWHQPCAADLRVPRPTLAAFRFTSS